MKKINGYVAAPFTPMKENGDINLDFIPEYADFLIRNGLDGAFICGSSGEGALLTREERMAVAEAWVDAAGDNLKVIVHTGGTNLTDQKTLAQHTQKIGAFGVAAMAPAFLPPRRNEEFVAYCKEIASAAPELSFYYYHIPPLNGFNMSVVELLKAVDKEIPNFVGVKYTHDNLYEFDQCKYVANGKFEMLHGLDETYLSALAYGFSGGVGGTYNHCFSLFREMKEAYAAGDHIKCRELQHKSHLFINVLGMFRGNIVCGKRIMKFMGIDCGPNRLPLQTISVQEEISMKKELETIGFFDYCNK
ncbi:MAG: N-acetylneuraminate lyase [Prolixibacteraceae bacterium]|jgi:N-acetylneuraminate lyase|nr:N-acetylneuraminate lyase [Prolixibacteraceae bacterium]MBT6998229.1 N-acetylneuraminate lyase [Prolixibacteraceae bacterium]MBT7394155.1 N-acetylneuraminate lyase [Prolixibacteraceae bacterium]